MSRALDQETVASLASADPQKAYQEISAIFTAGALPCRLEIEILGHLPEDEGGGSGAVVLRDGPAVAIAKKGLVQAFFVARRVLQGALKQRTKAKGDDELQAATLAAATSVLLLLDPEHLSAANTRKRLLQARLARAQTEDRAALLADELVFVDSLVTSHLHRHTKSPTLWSHRRWVLTQREAPLDGDAVRGDITNVVMVAAVRHPRNYYAWGHARWLVAQHSDGGESGQTMVLLVATVRAWCFQHHTDTSGWSFLLYLLLASKTTGRDQLLQDTLAQTEQRATALQWTGEAVWVFLRTATAAAAAAGEDEQSTARFRDTATALQGGLDPASRDHQVLQQAQDWLSMAFHG